MSKSKRGFDIDWLSSEDERVVISLWQERFGAPESHIMDWLEQVDSPLSRTNGFVVRDGNKRVVGFIIVTVNTEKWLNDEYIGWSDMFVNGWEHMGLIHMVCVDQSFESQGIGTLLMQRAINWFEIMSVDGIAAVSWVRDEHYGSVPLFEKFGLDVTAFDDDFYSSLDEDVYCTVCENGCECGSAMLKADWESITQKPD